MSEKALGSKLINSIWKYISEKQNELPLYHGNDVSEFIPASTECCFSTKKRAKINYNEIINLVSRLFEHNNTAVSGMAFLLDGELVGEYHKVPYTKEYRHVSYSVSKTIVALGFGIAVSKGFISVDTRLTSIFPEQKRIFTKANMKNITFKHLLTMTAGVTFDEMSSYFSFDWRKDFVSGDVMSSPGEEFYYNSLNSYMIVAAICKVTGVSFMDFMKEHLFSPMGITDITWDRCPMGVERGGWGMKLSLIDMLKFGQLILDEGNWQGIQLLESEWIRELTTCHVELKDRKIIYGYGYSIWLLRDGAFLMNGLFGQNVYINPDKRLVIATISSGEELFPDGEIVESICKFASIDNNFFYNK
ncbi:MAG: serine hydrolase, partial [Lachnospiraceae bacterium]|nr:serine hydrolase [Lachnospiraceae bacterium]